jgi:hypothetical protein
MMIIKHKWIWNRVDLGQPIEIRTINILNFKIIKIYMINPLIKIKFK